MAWTGNGRGRGVIRWLAVLGLCAIALAVTAQVRPAPAFTAEQLNALPTTGWITNGGNLANQRYSPLRQINRGNVAQLKGKWRTHLEGSGLGTNHSGQGQPIVHDGVIYITTGESDAFAVAVDTGRILWRYKAGIDPARVRACCGWNNRGVALGDGKVFVSRLDARLVALDQRNGEVVWSVQAEDPVAGFTITSAPLYYDGMVITGFAGGEVGIRGRIKAFDAKTGRLLWTFYTVPGPGEFGHDTWPADNDAWKYGGAPIWQTPAVDPALGLLYFSTGNAGPDYNGGQRAGDNLFTVSIVALEAKTGRYRWHFQQVRHDIWDYDSPNPVILFDAPVEGRMRKGLAEVSKTGWVYILDRETGKPLLPIEDRPVPQEPRQRTAATQPFVIGDPVVPQFIDIAPEGFELVNQGAIFTPFWDQVTLYKPQMGANWPPSSYDPESHYMFICGADHVGVGQSDGKEEFVPPGPTGYWAGGLVFVGRQDGRFTALDSSNGRRLWSFQTDAGVVAPASTFEHGGKQYVVVLSAGAMINGGRRGDSLWLFSLDGTIESLPADAAAVPAAAGTQGGAAPAGAPTAGQAAAPADGAASLAEGARIYRQFCLACHGEGGTGGQGNGASLETIGGDARLVATIASNGKNTMPAFRGTLTPEQLRDVAQYIAGELFNTGHGN